MQWITDHESILRLSAFFGVFMFMALWELAGPRRALSRPKGFRWLNNLLLVGLDTLVLRLVFPAAAVGIAILARENGWGLLSLVELPLWLTLVGGILVLDFTVWAQHVFFHAVPALWRLHRMHHADPDIDVTTGLRFHPLEILLSMLIKGMVIIALGLPVVAVLLFEVLLNATAMFNHANVRLPAALDRVLRWLVVTPDMHRVHHSWHPHETNSNFGFNLPWWDRLLGTYRAQPQEGHEGMTIGLHQFREIGDTRLDRLLLQPWREEAPDYPINKR